MFDLNENNNYKKVENRKSRFLCDMKIKCCFTNVKIKCCFIFVRDFNPKPFRCFDAWLEESDFEKVAEAAWANRATSWTKKFGTKIKIVKEDLRVWSKQRFGDLDSDLVSSKALANRFELEAESHALFDSKVTVGRRLGQNGWTRRQKSLIFFGKSKGQMDSRRGRKLPLVSKKNMQHKRYLY